jgi:hypothetical protein
MLLLLVANSRSVYFMLMSKAEVPKEPHQRTMVERGNTACFS